MNAESAIVGVAAAAGGIFLYETFLAPPPPSIVPKIVEESGKILLTLYVDPVVAIWRNVKEIFSKLYNWQFNIVGNIVVITIIVNGYKIFLEMNLNAVQKLLYLRKITDYLPSFPRNPFRATENVLNEANSFPNNKQIRDLSMQIANKMQRNIKPKQKPTMKPKFEPEPKKGTFINTGGKIMESILIESKGKEEKDEEPTILEKSMEIEELIETKKNEAINELDIKIQKKMTGESITKQINENKPPESKPVEIEVTDQMDEDDEFTRQLKIYNNIIKTIALFRQSNLVLLRSIIEENSVRNLSAIFSEGFTLNITENPTEDNIGKKIKVFQESINRAKDALNRTIEKIERKIKNYQSNTLKQFEDISDNFIAQNLQKIEFLKSLLDILK